MRRRPLFYVFAVVALLLFLAAVAAAWRLKRFVDSDPRLCAQCHRASAEFSLWSKGSHQSVACQRCHHSTPEQGLAMLRAFVAGRSPAGSKTHAPVEIGSCASCHLSHDGNWPQVGSSRGHRIHFTEKGIACVTCHAEGMHGFHPLTEACKKCHGAHTVQAQGMARLHCFVCHDFLSPDPGLLPTRRDCLRCHRAEGVHPARFSEGAAMQFDCGTCHKPHAPTPREAVVACTSCHVVAEEAGLHARHRKAACTACHGPHLWKPTGEDCRRCHAGADSHARERACTTCHAFRTVAPRRPGAGK
jgi:hypothetical protein